MIIKIIIGIVIYILVLILICAFFKGASINEKEYYEKEEREKILKEIEKNSKE